MNDAHLTTALSARLADNIKQLRGARGRTQQQMATLAGVPRATWANLESGAANPTLFVLYAAASALRVSLEELLARPRATGRHYPQGSLPERRRGAVNIRELLPDPVPGMRIERMQLPPGAQMTGTPHTQGTREYLACERGTLRLVASGDRFLLEAGDVVAFRGDQRHSYKNVGQIIAVGYAVVTLVSPLSVASGGG
ncbi:MAG TPA: XRE family transcriptional regulator [Polyangiaceae bacterium]|nr:XRE family transcriptional regulator [Polyangiaceae bacterium]